MGQAGLRKLRARLLLKHIPSNFLKAVFHKIYLVHSWILFPIYDGDLTGV